MRPRSHKSRNLFSEKPPGQSTTLARTIKGRPAWPARAPLVGQTAPRGGEGGRGRFQGGSTKEARSGSAPWPFESKDFWAPPIFRRAAPPLARRALPFVRPARAPNSRTPKPQPPCSSPLREHRGPASFSALFRPLRPASGTFRGTFGNIRAVSPANPAVRGQLAIPSPNSTTAANKAAAWIPRHGTQPTASIARRRWVRRQSAAPAASASASAAPAPVHSPACAVTALAP